MNDRKNQLNSPCSTKKPTNQHSAVKYLVLLRQDLLPEMRELSDFLTFQQDSTPAHRARPVAAPEKFHSRVTTGGTIISNGTHFPCREAAPSNRLGVWGSALAPPAGSGADALWA